MREEREARETAERRFNEAQAQWQRQFAELQARIPKQEPQAAPSVFEDEQGFLRHGLDQAVTPIRSELTILREELSEHRAAIKHGEETVAAARKWLAEGIGRDPARHALWQRSLQSRDPYGDIVSEYKRSTVHQQIGDDPNAWFEKQLDERMKDQAFAGSLLAKIQNGAAAVQSGGSGRPNVKLPPSLNKVASAQGATADDSDMSDEALFAHAMR